MSDKPTIHVHKWDESDDVDRNYCFSPEIDAAFDADRYPGMFTDLEPGVYELTRVAPEPDYP